MDKLLMIIGMVLVLSFGCIQGGEGADASSSEWESGEVSESGQPVVQNNNSGEGSAGEAGDESAESGAECAPEAEGNESGLGEEASPEEGEGTSEDASGQQAEEGLISLEEAQQIALASSCMDEGSVLVEDYTYNNATKTWWFETNITKPGCMPACVVDEETLSAQINWRCTGLIVE
jgi:hypothetical protein